MATVSRAKQLLNTRIYATILVALTLALYAFIRIVQTEPDRIAIAIVPAIFFTLCLQSATYMMWKFRQNGQEKVYDCPTSILAMGSAVVFYQLGSTTVAFLCFAISCIVFPELQTQRYSQAVVKVTMGTIAMASSILVFNLLEFEINASLEVFIIQIVFAAIAAGLASRSMLSFNKYTILNDQRPRDDQLASAFLRVVPLALFSGLLGRYYFEFGPSLLWAFAIPIVMYYLLASSSIEIQTAETRALSILIRALESKDRYTAHHADRVAMFAVRVGKEMGLSKRRLQKLEHAALLHDIGKLVIPDNILNKPTFLTEEEYRIVLRHDLVTAEVLKRIDFLKTTANFLGLSYNSIEYMSDKYLEPHIIAVCDAFDAMTSSRAYRKALTQETAIEELKKNIGTQFRQDVVEAMIKVIETSPSKFGLGYEIDVYHQDAPVSGVGSAGLTHSQALLVQRKLIIKNNVDEEFIVNDERLFTEST